MRCISSILLLILLLIDWIFLKHLPAYHPRLLRKVEPKIIGGSKVEVGEFPYVVAVFVSFNNSNSQGLCGGSLIHKEWVVTAGHCFHNGDYKSVTLIFGVTNYMSGKMFPDTERSADKVFIHPKYDDEDADLTYDIALIHLARSIAYNERIQAIEIGENRVQPLTKVITLGWGTTKEIPETEDLRIASLTTITNDECGSIFGYWRVRNTQICARGVEQGACTGDSGGPLVDITNKEKHVLIGITSYGDENCDPQYPTVWVRTSELKKWIKAHTDTKAKEYTPAGSVRRLSYNSAFSITVFIFAEFVLS